jgi:hypothetical protein
MKYDHVVYRQKLFEMIETIKNRRTRKMKKDVTD